MSSMTEQALGDIEAIIISYLTCRKILFGMMGENVKNLRTSTLKSDERIKQRLIRL